jgi:hypothetical protein
VLPASWARAHDVGFQARVGFARRGGEEKGADTRFRPRATTNKAAARRETAASGSEQSNIARAAKPKRNVAKNTSDHSGLNSPLGQQEF